MKNTLNKTRIAEAKRIVVKIGSVLLVDDNSGTLHNAWLNSLGKDVAALRDRGHEVILVSSGAIALGRRYLELKPCLLYTSPSPRDGLLSRMPSSA